MNAAKELPGGKGFSCVAPALGCEGYEETGSVAISPSAPSQAAILWEENLGKDMHVAKIFLGKAQIQFSTFMRDSPEISANGRRPQPKEARGFRIRLWACRPRGDEQRRRCSSWRAAVWRWTSGLYKSEGRRGCCRQKVTGIMKTPRAATDCQPWAVAGEMPQEITGGIGLLGQCEREAWAALRRHDVWRLHQGNFTFLQAPLTFSFTKRRQS